MIKIEYKRWVLNIVRGWSWFGYTYVNFPRADGGWEGQWYKNDSSLVRSLRQLDAAEAREKGLLERND